jgi:hypothetical protein
LSFFLILNQFGLSFLCLSFVFSSFHFNFLVTFLSFNYSPVVSSLFWLPALFFSLKCSFSIISSS